MFTGLIKEVGTIKQIRANAEGKVFIIEAPKIISEVGIDDSIATNGVCLTATNIKGNTFEVQAVHVTLEKTSLGKLKIADKVNLELALRPIDRLGGHFVQGHVNGVGKIQNIKPMGDNYEVTVSVPTPLTKYIITEGSIALDGISLTVARIPKDGLITVSIIPHTYEVTVLKHRSVGESINIEVDMMAKYLENFIKYDNKYTSPKLENLMTENNYGN